MIQRQQILESRNFQDFLGLVQQQLDQQRPDGDQLRQTLQDERSQLEAQCRGWRMSLGNVDLSQPLRTALEADLTAALSRLNEIDRRQQELASQQHQQQAAVDPEAVADRLEQFDEILAGDNASATNLMLSQHVAAIECDADGNVVVRMCRLGALGNPQDLCVADTDALGTAEKGDLSGPGGGGRRRTRRDVKAGIDDDDFVDAANAFAVDPDRFAGLGPEWFSVDHFQVPRRLSWAEEHAHAVATYRHDNSATMEETAARFGKTVPTIRSALRYAKSQFGIDAFGKQVSQPRRRNWSQDHAAEVAAYFNRPGATMKDAQQHFGKSQPTISKAKKYASGLQEAPDREGGGGGDSADKRDEGPLASTERQGHDAA